MKALTYISHERFALLEKPKPTLQGPRDAIVQVTLGEIEEAYRIFENRLDGVIKVAVTAE